VRSGESRTFSAKIWHATKSGSLKVQLTSLNHAAAISGEYGKSNLPTTAEVSESFEITDDG
jgi:hypothetical protein